jgi:hypothetical protein
MADGGARAAGRTAFGGSACWWPGLEATRSWVASLREALAKLGWTEGRNLQIELRFGENDVNRVRAQARSW